MRKTQTPNSTPAELHFKYRKKAGHWTKKEKVSVSYAKQDGLSFAKNLCSSYLSLKNVIREEQRYIQPVKVRSGHIVPR